MELSLIVVRPFDGLARGEVVSDPEKIAAILASENALHVVRVAAQSPAAKGV